MVAKTHSPDAVLIDVGAGTAAAQAAKPRLYASPNGYGWVTTKPVPATGAVAGNPGTFTPAGGHVASLAGMASLTATPATAWTTNQHVVLDDGTFAHWQGTIWAAGKSTAVAGATQQPAAPPPGDS